MEFMSDAVSGDDLYRPSLFELVAQDQLRELMQPAIRYVLSVVAQRNPRYLIRLVNRFDEFYALIMLLIERYYLKEWGSSFAENFYGLKRRRSPAVFTHRAHAAVKMPEEHEKLRPNQRGVSLLFLVGLPYLSAKAHDLWERWGGGVDQNVFEEDRFASSLHQPYDNRRERLMKIIRASYRRAYPYANLTWQMYLLVYQVGYLFEKTHYYRPWLKFMRVEIRRMSAQDSADAWERTLKRIVPRLAQPLSFWTLPAYTLALIRRTPQIAFEGVKYLLPLSIFLFKFLEWWYTSDHYRSSGQAGRLALGPPAMIQPHPDGALVAPNKLGICPICGNSFTNPTALPSGYVFCYKCAFAHVSERHSCPVTLTPVHESQFRKVLL